ncbi:MAG TPA: DUF1254 domain-containing protein [Vicinamibacterales bacterium]
MRMAESGGASSVGGFSGSQPSPRADASDATREYPVDPRLSQSISLADARAIAKEAYVYGFPMVESYRIQHSYFVDRGSPQFKAPWNQIVHDAHVYTPADATVPTPVLDTVFSYLGADLRTEPLVLTMPAVEKGRYYSAQFVDMYTFNFAYAGSRTTGHKAVRILLVGPRWKAPRPEGITNVMRCETDFAFVRFRTQLFSSGDIDNVRRIQAGYTVQPLSTFLGEAPPAPAPRIDFIRPLKPAQACTSLEFFNVLNFLLRFCPTHPSERGLMIRFAKLGIGAGRPFTIQALAPDLRAAIEDGIVDAWLADTEVAKGVAAGALAAEDLCGTRGTLKNAYLYRMASALDGLYRDSREETVSWVTYVDVAGEKIDTARSRYMLRFEPGQLPPVNAFWSVTLYELPSQRLSPNPRDRYLINSAMLPGLRRDVDGGLTIYIQHESPGAHMDPNWLPAPKGRVKLALRLYAPRPEGQHGWKTPSLQRAE